MKRSVLDVDPMDHLYDEPRPAKHNAGYDPFTAVTFLLVGLGAGAVLALFAAPRPPSGVIRPKASQSVTAREAPVDWQRASG